MEGMEGIMATTEDTQALRERLLVTAMQIIETKGLPLEVSNVIAIAEKLERYITNAD